MKAVEQERHVSLPEVARRLGPLGLSYSAVYRLALLGEIKVCRLGARWYVPAEEVERVVRARRVAAVRD